MAGCLEGRSGQRGQQVRGCEAGVCLACSGKCKEAWPEWSESGEIEIRTKRLRQEASGHVFP